MPGVANAFYSNNSINQSWHTELQNMGYPQQTRNIAISNGSHCANPQPLLPEDELLSITGNANTSFLTDMLSLVLNPMYPVGGALAINEPSLLLSILPGSNHIHANFKSRALPINFNTKEIYKGSLIYTKKLLWFIPINFNLIPYYRVEAISNQCYEYYPGGQYSLPFVMDDSQNIGLDTDNDGEVNIKFADYSIQANSVNAFSFIPTASALDVGNGTTYLNKEDYLESYTVNDVPTSSGLNTPFQNFTSSISDNNNLNEEHISFNTRNGNWLAEELEADILDPDYPPIADCSFFCEANNLISGPSTLCDTATFTFTSGATSINWSLEPSNAGSIVIDSNNPLEVTVTKSPQYNGYAFLWASVETENCGIIDQNKRIFFGAPTFSQTPQVSGSNNLNPGQTGLYSVNTSYFVNASSFEWRILSYQFQNASQYFDLVTVNNGTFSVKPDFNVPGGYYEIQLRAGNFCGYRTVSKSTYVEEGGGVPVLYRVYPNPSSTSFNIGLISAEILPINSNGIRGELLDRNGQFLKSIDIINNRATVSVDDIDTGMYVLKIYFDDKIEGHQVVIE